MLAPGRLLGSGPARLWASLVTERKYLETNYSRNTVSSRDRPPGKSFLCRLLVALHVALYFIMFAADRRIIFFRPWFSLKLAHDIDKIKVSIDHG